jgi:hypothetical protein
MYSKLASVVKRAALAESRRLTPEARLEAFLVHSRLMTELHQRWSVLVLTDEHGDRVDFIVGLRGLEAGAFSHAVEFRFTERRYASSASRISLR